MKERDLNADLIRCVAVFSVVSVHFLLNSKFYTVPVQGPGMYFMCLMRSLFMVCVPLFMILTGYLMSRKTLSFHYYKGIRKTLEIYLLASVACLLFKKFALGQAVTLKSAVLGILDFDAANYAWYIEMYIGLFLVIPFLNGAYHSLRGKRQKQILVLTMMALTMAPRLLNNFDLATEGWWADPASSSSYTPLVPGFFTGMYPITYYMIGAYLKEYGWNLGKGKNLLLLLLCVLLFGSYNYYRSRGVNFIWGTNCAWGGENLMTASLLFTLLLHINVKKWPAWIHGGMRYLSGVSLGLYLISWIFDQIIYKWFLGWAPEVEERFVFYPLIVPLVFVSALGGAVLLYGVRDAGGSLVGFLRKIGRKAV